MRQADTGLAPIQVIPKALARAGLSVGDVSLFEINEAFASVCVATSRELGLDEELVNVNGSGCSLGHPVAATGARMARRCCSSAPISISRNTASTC